MILIQAQIRLIIFLLLSSFLSACVSQPRLTEIVNEPDEKWRITSVVIVQDDNVWKVSGRLNAPSTFGLPNGNILISVVAKDGKLIEQKSVNYSRLVRTLKWRNHRFGVAVFSTTFEQIPSNSTVIAEVLSTCQSHLEL